MSTVTQSSVQLKKSKRFNYYDLVFQSLKSLGNHPRQFVVEAFLSARSQMPAFILPDLFYLESILSMKWVASGSLTYRSYRSFTSMMSITNLTQPNPLRGDHFGSVTPAVASSPLALAFGIASGAESLRRF